ncbi:MAG: hypothetical protein EF813_00290 [Methanosarcinales archaeon]|nr:MAG: hypothetical protein EF813_00290 [Methanosarcinales archaeon]
MYDMILAGGGHVGAVAAERAAQKGLSVLVLEKETYPRDNARGCVVSQKSLDVIRGGIDMKLIEEEEVFSGRIFLPDYQSFTGRLSSCIPVIVMERPGKFLAVTTLSIYRQRYLT